MPFNSISFLIFFILFSIAYYIFHGIKSRMIILIAGSWIFYSYANILNLLFLIIIIIVTFIFVKQIRKHQRNTSFLVVGIIIIVLQLLIAKYSHVISQLNPAIFFSKNDFLDYSFLPIGISFYSLQAISLLVDVQKRKYNNDLRFKDVILFLSFFPQSIAGPIHRASELIPQFEVHKNFQTNNIIIGLKTMLWGFFCKLIVADKISLIVSPVFSSYYEQNGLSLALAALLYSLQIYFDFWGYSLIAIGAGRVLGFKINVNFIAPYSASSFKDFWHRWHITLSRWMRDYIYIPLGGRYQKTYLLFFVSILITFIVSGFWHGVTTNFILWGATHAFLYLVEDIIRRHWKVIEREKISLFVYGLFRLLRTISFFITISLTWLIFRTDSISDLLELLRKITEFSDWSLSSTLQHYLKLTNISYLLIIITASLLSQTKFLKRKTELVPTSSIEKMSDSFYICICLILIVLWGDIGGQEFVYFRF